MLRAKWNAIGKKGLEATGIRADNSQKGINSILDSEKSREGGSKFMNLIAAAMQQHKEADEPVKNTQNQSSRRMTAKR